jgi:tetratricopeptide (TPR) repeat protein
MPCVKCVHCGHVAEFPDALLGKEVRCASCAKTIAAIPTRFPHKPKDETGSRQVLSPHGSQSSRRSPAQCVPPPTVRRWYIRARFVAVLALIASAIGLSFAIPAIVRVSARNSYNAFYLEAVKASAVRDYFTAVRKADVAASFTQNDAELTSLDLLAGYALVELGNYNQAIDRLTAGLERIERAGQIDQSTLYQFFERRATCYEAIGRTELAAADRKAAHEASEVSHAKFMTEELATGSALAAAGKHREAISHYSRMLDELQSLNSDERAGILKARAESYDAIGRADMAEADRKAAITVRNSTRR